MKIGLSIRPIDARRVAALAVTLLTIGFWLVIASYPNFFLFNPLLTTDPVLKFEQVLSTIGWVLAAVFPLICAWVPIINSKSTKPIYLIAATLWPISILAIQVTLAVYGFGFYGYIGTYPILALSDLIAPVFLVIYSGTLFSIKDTATE